MDGIKLFDSNNNMTMKISIFFNITILDMIFEFLSQIEIFTTSLSKSHSPILFIFFVDTRENE